MEPGSTLRISCQLGGNSVNVDGHKLCNHAILDCNIEHGRHGNDGKSFHLLDGESDVIMVNNEKERCRNEDRAYLKSSNCQVIDTVHSNLN